MGSNMWFSRASILLAVCAGLAAWAQDSPVGGAPAQAPAPASVLENTGKPMLLPFQCSDEDIRSAGLSCSDEEPCANFLELSVASSAGSRILAAGNLHTDSVTLYSILLASEDGGHTWAEAHERIRGGSLDHIQFHDAENGWISGQELSPLPQNPFLLVTSDGGKTWKQRPILNEATENRFGTILQFSFDAKDAGRLIVDRGAGAEGGRYALYESPNGGENWLIKQESTKPIPLKTAPAQVAAWRIRVDAPSKSFHIERRQGDRWSSVGAFLVRLEPCKPPKPVETEPPADDKTKPPIKKQQE
jgi:hypothetical protein